MKSNQEQLDEMYFMDDDGKPIEKGVCIRLTSADLAALILWGKLWDNRFGLDGNDIILYNRFCEGYNKIENE